MKKLNLKFYGLPVLLLLLLSFYNLTAFSVTTGESSGLKLPALISDNMLLQRSENTAVWGWVNDNTEVQVQIAGIQSSSVGKDGKWMVHLNLNTLADGPFEMTVKAGSESITVKNILIGDVWLCSGQSNMQWPMARTLNAEEEIAAANYPSIRLFFVKRRASDVPVDDVEGQWKECNPENVKDITAVGYFFARNVYQKTGKPIGILDSSWGGSRAEAWTPAKTLKAYPELTHYLTDPPVETLVHRPLLLYNGMIYPLLNFAIKGTLWYQGESNAHAAKEYRTLFPAMITAWRELWNRGDFPFYFVQLTSFRPNSNNWPPLREAQLMTLSLPNTGMAVIMDIGDSTDIHPRNKQDVGYRLSLIALNRVYGIKTPDSGPVYKAMKVKKNKIELSFDNAYEGLVFKGGEPIGFEIRGNTGNYVPASAKIKKNKILVWNEGVIEPAAVRYGWSGFSACNLYNSASLPASPFRTNTEEPDSE